MEEGFLSLKWNNHSSTFLKSLQILNEKNFYSDLSLYCGGQLYHVHKFVLSTCSDFFSDLLVNFTDKNPIIVLNNLKKTDLEALLSYMYGGEASVAQCDLTSLIKAAEAYKVKGLAVPDNFESLSSTEENLHSDIKSKKRKHNSQKDFSEQESNNSQKLSQEKIQKTVENQVKEEIILKDEDIIIEDPKEIYSAPLESNVENTCESPIDYDISREDSNISYTSGDLHLDNYEDFPLSNNDSVIQNESNLGYSRDPMASGGGLLQRANEYVTLLDKKGIQCDYPMCNFLGRSPSALNVHYRKHTGERPYKCPLCPFAAAQKNNLKNHLVSKHNTDSI